MLSKSRTNVNQLYKLQMDDKKEISMLEVIDEEDNSNTINAVAL